MQRVSEAVRKHTNYAGDDSLPYGTDWDVLWVGHCGEEVKTDAPVTKFADPDTVPRDAYVGGVGGSDYKDHVGDGERLIQTTAHAHCTFAYAVHAGSVAKVLDLVNHGAEVAFDLMIKTSCIHGALRCLTVNPEVMHHFKPAGKFGRSSEVGQHNGEGEFSADVHAADVEGTTNNVVDSARCYALFRRKCSS